ncbi:MAG: hypothetical protein HFJ10_02070 [Lachnospiraceae bacterium]|nr:hypothetical protein [Lachnospiraceae bacterium]
MILSDLLVDYEYVYNALIECTDYFSACDELIDDYFSTISNAAGTFFKLSQVFDSDKNELIHQLRNTYDNSFATITKMITLSFPFYGTMTKLKEYEFKNTVLEKDVHEFLQHGHDVMDATNEIITAQLPGMKANALLPILIEPLRQLTQSYYTLKKYATHFYDIDKMLFETIPENELDSQQYNNIELRSMKPLLDFSSFADDIKYLASFISQYESIMNSSSGGETAKIYTQRIENGSLRIVWGSHTIELSRISGIIKAISEGIRMFRMTTSERRAIDENTRTKKLENDEKELAIINSQIKNIAQFTGLSSDNPEDVEKMQKLCLPLVRYIYNNPIGMIGNYKYNLNNDLKLIESFYNSQEISPISDENNGQ